MNITQKQEFRYKFAGMAMQAILSSALQDKDPLSALAMMTNEGMEGTAKIAVGYADALIKELDERDKDN